MARIMVKFQCGCKFTTTNPKEAERHVDSTGHTLDILGRVLPDSKVKKEK